MLGTRTSRKIFTLADFPIFVDLTFLILGAFFVFQSFGDTIGENFAAMMRFPVLFGSILLHELGHAFAIRKLGYGNSRILLWGMGGLCINGRHSTDKHGPMIALAGPGAGLMLGIPLLLLYMFVPLHPVAASIVYFSIFVNVGWSLLNLLPIIPLDGGNSLIYLLRLVLKQSRHKSIRIAGLVGLILLVPLALFALANFDLWMLFILFFLGQNTWQAWSQGSRAVSR